MKRKGKTHRLTIIRFLPNSRHKGRTSFIKRERLKRVLNAGIQLSVVETKIAKLVRDIRADSTEPAHTRNA